MTGDSTWSSLSNEFSAQRGGYFSRREGQVEERERSSCNGVKFEKRGNGSTSIQRPLVLCTLRQKGKEKREREKEKNFLKGERF